MYLKTNKLISYYIFSLDLSDGSFSKENSFVDIVYFL